LEVAKVFLGILNRLMWKFGLIGTIYSEI
jgi:hypothetical protein